MKRKRTSSKISNDSQASNWVQEFSTAIVQCFELGLSGDALISSGIAAAKRPMNAARVAGMVRLADSFEVFSKSVLELLHVREAIKVTDSAAKTQQLIHDYRATM